ncbi:hypothetical protein [Avibacterium sp. 21-594]|uniref:hypothetical protein n=1 Tax=Avibacterium sp. 21-594 TaxID=2911535 RepID=UPI00224731CF|nr:hypothetical protein [Avibacterium sp. 21-594]MCW9715287.1 hypothetical protein [Avibacterium sp. 21-594]
MISFLNVSNYNDLLSLIDKLKVYNHIDIEKEVTLLKEFESPHFTNHIRNIVMRTVGTSKLPEIIDSIDKFITSIEPKLPKDCSEVFFSNIAFWASSYFWKNITLFADRFSTLGYSASTLFMANPNNLKKIIEYISQNRVITLSPVLCMQIAFRNTVNNFKDEKLILPMLLERMNPRSGDRIAVSALKQRLQSINKTFEIKSTKRKALFICGQFRDIEMTIPRLTNYFDINNLDIYISSWLKPGSTRIDPVRLNRRVESSAIDQILEKFNKEELEQIANYEDIERNKNIKNTKLILEQGFSQAKKLKISLLDDDDVIYKLMDNHEKMHFHNLYWIRKLGKKFFLENYDIIIKTRPDILLSIPEKVSSHLYEISSQDIYCDHPEWLYETWGFGMGDQLFYGNTELMLSLLDIKYPESLSTRLLSETFHLGRLTQGHINIGIELWLRGGRPTKIPELIKRGLASEKKLTLEEFLDLANNVI